MSGFSDKKDYNIERFYSVHRDYFDIALREIRGGRKMTHWMWYIFPQLKMLGSSHNAVYYGLENKVEALKFYEDDCLGRNLREICAALLCCVSDDPFEVMGYPDNIKLCSSMTLFYEATGDELFLAVIDKFYAGKKDKSTLSLLESL